jgi:hypothetical protein
MKRIESLAGSPALIAVFVVSVGVLGLQKGSDASAERQVAPAAVVAPASNQDVPLIGELTVTARRG